MTVPDRSHPLYGCRAKLTRAMSHTKALNAEVRVYLGTYPYEPVVDRDPKTGEGLVRVRVKVPPPIEWSIRVGEIVHDIRSALDHLVWELAFLESGPPPRPVPVRSPWKGLQFPIFVTERGYQKREAQFLWGVADSDRTLIEAEQPYNRSKDHPASDMLWRLHDLSSIDKHRTVHLLGPYFWPSTKPVNFTVDEGWVHNVTVADQGPLKDGAELARFTVEATAEAKPRVQVNLDITFDVAFDEPSPITGWRIDFITALIPIWHRVSSIVDTFDDRF